MTEIEIAMVGYQCRTCGESTEVGISPRVVDDEMYLCPVNHRLAVTECGECGQERTHVLDAPKVDAARGYPPIDDIATEKEASEGDSEGNESQGSLLTEGGGPATIDELAYTDPDDDIYLELREEEMGMRAVRGYVDEINDERPEHDAVTIAVRDDRMRMRLHFRFVWSQDELGLEPTIDVTTPSTRVEIVAASIETLEISPTDQRQAAREILEESLEDGAA